MNKYKVTFGEGVFAYHICAPTIPALLESLKAVGYNTDAITKIKKVL